MSGAHHDGLLGLDGLAISASTLCLVHCLVLPIAIAFLPALADWGEWGEAVHIVMLVVAVPLSGGALFGGWRRHRSTGPLLTGAAGLILLALGLATEGSWWGTTLTVAGGLALAVAHIGNVRATRLQYLTGL